MKFLIVISLAFLVGRIDCENKKLREIFSWKIMDYAWEKPEDKEAAIASKEFIQSNNLILGLDRWKNKLFVTVPRWKAGVVSTLNYINISGKSKKSKSKKSKDKGKSKSKSKSKGKGKNKGKGKGKDKKKKKPCRPKPKPPTTTPPPPPEETTTPPPPPEETTTPPPETTTPPPPPPETTTTPPPPPPPPETTTTPPPPPPPPEPTTTPPPPPEETTTPPPPPPTVIPNPETPIPDDPPTLAPTEPPPEDDDDDEDDEDDDDEEDPDVIIISGEEALRSNVRSMRRLISNFDFADPETLNRKSGEKGKKSKGKSKEGKGKSKGKGKDKGKKKPCKSKPKPTTAATPTTQPPPPPTSPLLIPYPSFEANRLVPKENRDPNAPAPITSVFRVRVDPCDRLWVMDSGLADILGNPEVVTKPRILIYDLKTDKLIREYKLQDSDSSEHSFFANIIVDVTADTCDKAFAYLPDLGGYAIVVYDFENNNSHKLTHNYFHFDPLAGNMVVGGVNFQWSDGVFSIALTKPDGDGVRDAYFHALASTKEFKVRTNILQSEDSKENYHEYKLVGDRGADSQSSASFIHEDTGVMFYTQLQKDSINCWNTNKKLSPENLVEVASDNETMIFTNDLKVDADSNLWVLTDKLPLFLNNKLDDEEVNYRIFMAPVKDAIAGTSCAP